MKKLFAVIAVALMNMSVAFAHDPGEHASKEGAVEGDHVRIYVTNRLSASTSVHWHGILLPSGMDGVGGVSQKAIQPGETFKYEYTLKQHGTFMYHSHHDEMTQMQLGMIGLFIVHAKNPAKPSPDRDYAILLREWKIEVGARPPAPTWDKYRAHKPDDHNQN
jgi:FtsP/CotA-like multicopper oxidase with cupredoxin domain